MNIRYVRDMKHRYMVLFGGRLSKEDYRFRMLERNGPLGLLPCHLRKVDGSDYLYYEVNGKISLQNRFSKESMSYGQLRQLLLDLGETLEGLSDYLLDESGLLFSGQTVYFGLEDMRAYFTYSPVTFCKEGSRQGTGADWHEEEGREQGFFEEAEIFAKEEESAKAPFYGDKGSFPTFTEYLLELVNPMDEEAVSLSYRICELAQTEGALIGEVLGYAGLGGENRHVGEEAGKASLPEEGKERRENPMKEAVFSGEEEVSFYEEGIMGINGEGGYLRSEEENLFSEKKEPTKKRGHLIGRLVMSALFLVLFAFVIYLRSYYELTRREQMISMAISLLTGAMAIACLLSLRRKREVPKKKEEKETGYGGKGESLGEGNVRENERESFGGGYAREKERELLVGGSIREKERESFGGGNASKNDREFFREGNARENDREFFSEENVREGMRKPFGKGRKKEWEGTLIRQSISEGGQETVLLSSYRSGIHKLYSKGGEQRIKIELESLPLTIGKMSGVADYVLEGEGISRLHARFFRKEGESHIYMKDLHSTNGSYRNGRRLMDEEEVRLVEGDELRFGTVEFDFV